MQEEQNALSCINWTHFVHFACWGESSTRSWFWCGKFCTDLLRNAVLLPPTVSQCLRSSRRPSPTNRSFPVGDSRTWNDQPDDVINFPLSIAPPPSSPQQLSVFLRVLHGLDSPRHLRGPSQVWHRVVEMCLRRSFSPSFAPTKCPSFWTSLFNFALDVASHLAYWIVYPFVCIGIGLYWSASV